MVRLAGRGRRPVLLVPVTVGAYTARKERRQRGGTYWVAYRTAAGRQHKLYLGKAEDLSLERLDAAAAALTGRATVAVGLPLLATKLGAPAEPPARYRIRIRGHLDPDWSAWFDGLTVTQAGDGTTELAGAPADQAALFGLLARLRDLGATLLLVERLTEEAGR